MDPDLELRRIAEQQHGLVTTTQAVELGLSRQQLWWRRRSGEWEQIGNVAIRLVGSPRTDGQRALGAVLSAGASAALARQSAAAWWIVPGFALEPFHVVRQRNATTRGGDSGPHESRMLPAHHVTVRGDVPVTTPARTVFDLAGVCHPLRVERALDTFWARNLITHASLTSIVHELGRRGRTGTRLMRRLLADRSPDYVAPETKLESRFVSLIGDAGDEPFERQVVLGDVGGRIGCVDFYDRARRLVVEIDSWRFHSSPSDRRNDAARDARLHSIGCTVHRVCEDDLIRRPAVVLATIRALRKQVDADAQAS